MICGWRPQFATAALLLCTLYFVTAAATTHEVVCRPTSGSSLGGARVVYNTTHLLVCGNGADVYDPGVFDNVTVDSIKHVGFHGVLLPDRIPVNWQNFSAMRSLVIDCAPITATAPPPAATRRGPAGTAAGAVNGSTVPQLFGSSKQLDSLLQFIMNKEGVSVHSISIVNCGMQGSYSEIWKNYLSGVQAVNLSGNALTGGFTSIDDFDTVCTDDFAGDDYADPDCSSANLHTLDVSRNNLTGPISTGAVLGDDVTDAVCSTGCLSVVLAPGVTNPQVVCMSPLVVFALDNPGLHFRSRIRFASGYVTLDRSNWCFEPASRWVLPTMWGVFLVLLAGTLSVTLYARMRLKRVPFRMCSPSFDVLVRGDSTEYLNGSSSAGRPDDVDVKGGRYMGLPSGKSGSVAVEVELSELAERQAMIPKGAALPPVLPYVNAAASYGPPSPTALPVSTLPATGPPERSPRKSVRCGSEGAVKGLNGGAKAVNGGVNGVGGRSGHKSHGRAVRQGDADGVRVALTAGLPNSSEQDAEQDSLAEFGNELYGVKDLEGAAEGGVAVSGVTLGSRAAAVAAGRPATGAGASGLDTTADGSWWPVVRPVLCRGLDMLGMQLRTLLIVGMFGLECYWAYGLIRYRGGWQLLVLIPNYLENTLAGVAMLRAFMAGTHGRWKYLAPVPLLPFAMSSIYLGYGFLAYPFGWADLGPVSWEKFIDLMDSCGVLSSTCWLIFASLAYWNGNSVSTSYQYFNTDIYVGMLLMCFTDLLSTAHHLASSLQVPFKQWLRKELDVRRIKIATDKSHRLQADDL